ncbi:hypothetical protein FRB90_004148, partial [Tulasnella sp. 427]
MRAANDYFGENVTYISCQTIASAFHALSGSADIAFLPIENSTHGPVIETLDLLRIASPETHFIRGEAVAAINHCLVARKGTKLEDVRTVLSHEQALGQCSDFLRERLPTAQPVKTVSTAAAAQQVLNDQTSSSAAICSSLCTKLYEDLVVLAQGIQDSAANVTRFVILSAPNATLPSSTSALSQEFSGRCAMLRITPPSNDKLGDAFAAIRPLAVSKVDRRPSLSPTPFQDTYFVTVQAREPINGSEWEEALNAAVRRLVGGLLVEEKACSVLG